jgi:ABC-type dipeptide/oligopeptide/nickel transport system permease component
MVILYSVVLIGAGLLVDLLYAWLDPRVGLER